MSIVLCLDDANALALAFDVSVMFLRLLLLPVSFAFVLLMCILVGRVSCKFACVVVVVMIASLCLWLFEFSMLLACWT